ncbi:hypothetical protein CAPTEDRAFT_157510 [Capitella teleta]|uniref:Enoyl reductase (ER) domain-containing protein n=1 Tax=Capitella teleta TaxID=283909 RepID=R7UG03_CAPTE|nr:hypothetical protein CAPTEDRAFT_157510 [Capitella teleta]|eukprot:ELU05464.1 hypothetical protein CAPTEDRAFT_157510 [Capitella teleta]
MRAVIKEEAGEGYVMREHVTTPEPEGDEVLIRVERVSICGSDIALYKWNEVARVIATVPFIPGHEAVGTVVKCGPQAALTIGQQIGVENHFYCGKCYCCEHERGDICQNMGQYGHGKKTTHGGFSQYSVLSSKYCFPLTRNITLDEAVLLEPCGVAHNAIEQLEIQGEDVLIIGCGPIGLLGCAVSKAMGARRVISADIDQSRLDLSKTMGSDLVVNTSREDLKEVIMRETQQNGIGRICEMSGAASMVNNMFSLLRKGGHVVMVGLPKTPLHVENPLPDIVFKSLTLKTVHGRRIFHTWLECERLIAEKKIDVLPVISHQLSMTQWETAFEALFSGSACKIILNPMK